jgi:D-alanyl-D-alanine carboxypeptidase
MEVSGSERPVAPAQRAGAPAGEQWRTAFYISLAAVIASILALLVVLVARINSGGGGGRVQFALTGSPSPTVATAAANGTATPVPGRATVEPPTPASTAARDLVVACGDILAPVDKQHVLARDCAPSDLQLLPVAVSAGGDQLLRAEAAAALIDMVAAAAKGGIAVFAISSYRSYDQQVTTFQQNVDSGGLAYAERTSARAGHSEHQLGTTTDLTSASAHFGLEGFAGTAEAMWVSDNSWKYGFIVSYPAGSEAVTGYAYEPWHVRYVGKDVARMVHDSGLTLHEYLLRR